MSQSGQGIAVIATIMLGGLLQLLFGHIESQDTPNKAVVEFCKAYYRLDDSMKGRLCDELLSSEDGDFVEQYIDKVAQEAKDRGFRMSYMKNCLAHIKTHTILKDDSSAEIHLTCERKPFIRSLFTGESHKVDKVIKVVKEDDQWKVCGNIFELAEN